MEHEPERIERLDRRLDRQPEGEPFGSVPRPERIGLLAPSPGTDPLPFDPEPGHERRARDLRDLPDPAQAETGKASTDVRVGREERGRQRGEVRGLAAGRDDERRGRSGMRGRDRGSEAGAGDPGSRRTGQDRRERGHDPGDEHRIRAPQPLEAVGLDLQAPEARIRRIRCAGQARAERGQPLERGLDRRPVGVRFRIEERRLRHEPVGGAQGHAPTDADRPRVGARVEHRPVGPRLAAQYDRALRKRRGA